MGRVIWVVQQVIVERTGVLGFCAVWLGNCHLTFRTNVPPLSPKHPGKPPPPKKTPSSTSGEKNLATNITFLNCVICSGCAVIFPLDLAYISLYHSLFLSLITHATVNIAVISSLFTCTYMEAVQDNSHFLFFPCPPLSFKHAHKHKHTHTHTGFKRQGIAGNAAGP
jgi:hypothetical protein